jgi:hypothetical protein
MRRPYYKWIDDAFLGDGLLGKVSHKFIILTMKSITGLLRPSLAARSL